MTCPHCAATMHLVEERRTGKRRLSLPDEDDPSDEFFEVRYGYCPACSRIVVVMDEGIVLGGGTTDIDSIVLYPKMSVRPVATEVPDPYARDFKEAAAVLNLSPKASAALSRRILQHVLRDNCGVKPGNLGKEIDEFIQKPGVPTHLAEAVDAVRNVGNFAAHPIKSTSTGEVVDVEPGEAEWLLDVLDSLFDFAFVQPSRLKTRKDALNQKLTDAGKKPMK
jgi:hypothetical protein